MTVRAVVFDIGNVLYEWHPRFLIDKLTDDEAVRERVLREVITLDWHFQHDAGRDFADTSRELIAAHPEDAAFVTAFGARFDETIRGPIPGMLEVIRELDDRGVPLFAITNFSHEFFPPFRDVNAEIFDRFRDIIVSGDERLVKPDHAIFELARTRFNLAAGQALFVDDSLANAEASGRCGFVPHHFTGVEALRQTLECEGLLTAV